MIERKCWCGGKAMSEDVAGRIVNRCLESSFHDPFSTGAPEQITKLYVAGPMSGYPDSNYPEFNQAARRLRFAGFEVVNPAAVHLERCHYVDLLREDLKVMLDCHGVAVLDKWWESTGGRNEVNVAGLLRMPVRTVEDWIVRAEMELGFNAFNVNDSK